MCVGGSQGRGKRCPKSGRERRRQGSWEGAAEQSRVRAPPAPLCQAGSAKSGEPGAGGRAGHNPALPPPPRGAQQLLRKV